MAAMLQKRKRKNIVNYPCTYLHKYIADVSFESQGFDSFVPRKKTSFVVSLNLCMVKQQIADNNFSKLILSKDELNESRNAFFF